MNKGLSYSIFEVQHKAETLNAKKVKGVKTWPINMYMELQTQVTDTVRKYGSNYGLEQGAASGIKKTWKN